MAQFQSGVVQKKKDFVKLRYLSHFCFTDSKPPAVKPSQFFFLWMWFCHCSPLLLHPRLPPPRLHLLSEWRSCEQCGAVGMRPWLPSHRKCNSNLPPHTTRLPRLGLCCTCVSRCVGMHFQYVACVYIFTINIYIKHKALIVYALSFMQNPTKLKWCQFKQHDNKSKNNIASIRKKKTNTITTIHKQNRYYDIYSNKTEYTQQLNKT